MIKSITVTNYLGESMVLELSNPNASGFIVEKIKGLGPGKANVNVTEVSTSDGGIYNSSRLPTRNIVISLRFLFNPTIEDSRQKTYEFFPIKKPVKLLIETDNRLAEIEGYVESNDPDIFSKEEGTDISILCPVPYFYSAETQTVVFSGIEPMFEFPFSNESLTEPLLILSEIINKREEVVIYEGDSETGITITIHAIGEASNITIYNTGTREVMRIDTDKLEEFTGSGIVNGDDIIICTIPGSKSITLVREGISTNILNCLQKDSDWFTLARGDNVFAYTTDSGSENLQFKIDSRIVYEGV